MAHFVPWAALEAVGVVGGIAGISFRDLLPQAPLEKETVDKLEALDFLRVDVFNTTKLEPRSASEDFGVAPQDQCLWGTARTPGCDTPSDAHDCPGSLS